MDKLIAMTTFIKVAETGSFTKAADFLGIPKSRVSQRVTELEDNLGIRLIQRTTRALSLTNDGFAYFDKAKGIIEEINEMEESLKGFAHSPKGQLYVESLTSIAKWIIAPHLDEFQKKFPDITLSLGCSDRVSDIFDEGVDCAIRGGLLQDSTLIARHIVDIHFGLYAAPSYLEQKKMISKPEELKYFKWISWFNYNRCQNSFDWSLESNFQKCEVSVKNGIHFSDPEVAVSACLAGNGICVAAPFAVETYVREGRLIPVLPEWHLPLRSIHIVYPSKKHLSSRVRSFTDWIVDLMKKHPTLNMTPKALAESLIT